MLIISGDGVLERYAKRIEGISEGDAIRVFVPALNRAGNQTRTLMKRSLVKQTGIKYGLVEAAIKTKRATKHRLEYELEARGKETNLNLFGAKQRKKGVSAKPWNKRRIFKSTFIIPRYGSKVYRRTSDARGPLKPVYGPNIGREIAKDPTVRYWHRVDGFLQTRIEHELKRLFG